MRGCEESPGADQVAVREHLTELEDLAAAHGITLLRSHSPGRLIGHLAEYRDVLDACEFEAAVGPVLSYSGRWVRVTGRPLSDADPQAEAVRRRLHGGAVRSTIIVSSRVEPRARLDRRLRRASCRRPHPSGRAQ